MNNPTPKEIQNMLQEYLELCEQLKEHRTEVEQRNAKIKCCTDRISALQPVIEKSVEPVCGSATKPTIRTYTNGRYRTISVFWDGRGGRIGITQNDVPENPPAT